MPPSDRDAAAAPAAADGTTGEREALPTEAELTAVLSSAPLSAQLNGPLADTHATVQYRVEPDGPAWWWSTLEEHPTTGVGEVANADVEVTCDAAIARALLDGTLDVSKAVLLGQARVRGDLEPLRRTRPASGVPAAGDG
ncbi:MAG: hypothetical protein R2754_11220 [Microthrixaceae bacterium]